MEEKIIIGRNPVIEYLKSNHSFSGTLLISQHAKGKNIDEILKLSKKRNLKTILTDKKEIERFSNYDNHQGVVLRITTSKSISDYKDLIKITSESNGVIVLLDQLTDPHNIGSIIRTAESLGACGVVMPKANTPEINSTIIKTSAGATAYLPVIKISNASSFLSECKKENIWVIGASEKSEKPLSQINDLRPAVLVIGNEGHGMRRLTEEKCDITVSIPLKGNISSLNASVACGIILYEMLK